MMTLIIKGDTVGALKACADRGIKIVRSTQHPRFYECIVKVSPDTSWEVLARWFCARAEAPFPDGSLLWYGPTYPALIGGTPKGWDEVEA